LSQCGAGTGQLHIDFALIGLVAPPADQLSRAQAIGDMDGGMMFYLQALAQFANK
jgi:hypothetical protein